MKDISLDLPTTTQYALGDLPADAARLLRLTHAAPGATMALADEVEEIQHAGRMLKAAFDTLEPAPDEAALELTATQRGKLLAMLDSPASAAPRRAELRLVSGGKARSSDARMAWKTTAWTFGAAAAVVGLLFLVRAPADSAGGNGSTAERMDGPPEYYSGKFKIKKPIESAKPFDSKDLANLAPLPFPTGPKKAVEPLPRANPAVPTLVETPANPLTNKPSLKDAIQPQRGPAPAPPGPNTETGGAFAAPK
jgi:hypothetical protein